MIFTWKVRKLGAGDIKRDSVAWRKLPFTLLALCYTASWFILSPKAFY